MTENIADVDVLIIGAGPAGIASAYAVQQSDISYRVVDRANRIGDTWASLYPSLKLNTSRFYSHLPKKRFPLSYGIFPSGKQYHQYLTEFVEEHQFNIKLGVDVQRVSAMGNMWQVESDRGIELYKSVISATGIFRNPIVPDIDGMQTFYGEIYHSSSFKDPEQVRGKRVLVVGNGPSGVDIAVAASDVASSTAIGIRSGIRFMRRYPLGIPKHGWMMVADNILPDAWCDSFSKFLKRFMAYPDTSAYGLAPPQDVKGGVTAYIGPELLDAVKAGKIAPVKAPVQFFKHDVKLADGKCLPFDAVIFATGFKPVLTQYLDVDLQYNPEPYQPPAFCDWEIGPNGQRGFPLRDTSEHPNGRQILGHPGLYLVGTFYKGKGAMFNMNVEAKIAADQIKTYLAEFEPHLDTVPNNPVSV